MMLDLYMEDIMSKALFVCVCMLDLYMEDIMSKALFVCVCVC